MSGRKSAKKKRRKASGAAKTSSSKKPKTSRRAKTPKKAKTPKRAKTAKPARRQRGARKPKAPGRRAPFALPDQEGPRRVGADETARLVADALAHAAGLEGDEAAAAAGAAMDRHRDESDTQAGDVFYVVGRPDGLHVASYWIQMQDDLQKFWEMVAEYVQVELGWWCGDHGRDIEPVLAAIHPALFHIGIDGVLREIGDQPAFDRTRAGQDIGRQYAFLDRNVDAARLLDGLTRRIEEAYGKPLRGALRFEKPPTPAAGKPT